MNGCYALNNVNIPNNIEEIPTSCFRESGISAIHISSGIKKIMPYAFWSCNSLSNIVIPQNVEKIFGGAFGSCTNLRDIKFDGDTTITSFNENMKYYADDVFQNDPIKRLVIYNDTQNLNSGKLKWSDNEKKILLNENQEIVFIYPSYLQNEETFIIPDNVKEWRYRLSGYSVKKMIFPSSLNLIDTAALPLTLTDVDITKNNNFKIIDNDLGHKMLCDNNNNLIYYMRNNDNEAKVPSTINQVLYYSLKGILASTLTLDAKIIQSSSLGSWQHKITLLKLGANVENYNALGYNSTEEFNISVDKENKKYFSENGILYENQEDGSCVLIRSCNNTNNDKSKIEIHSSANNKIVKSIGAYSFYSKTTIKEVVLDEGIIMINGHAFENCYALEKIEIPSSVTTIDTDAFKGCKSLSTKDNNEKGGIRINNKAGSISGAPWGATQGDKTVKWLK